MLRSLTAVGRGFLAFSRFAFWKPLAWSTRGVFRFFLVPLYSRYVKLKQRIKFHPRVAGIDSTGQFFNRYAVYLTLVLLGVFGIGTNLFARTIRPDEVGQAALWSSFLHGDQELIVDSSVAKSNHLHGVAFAAVGGAALATEDSASFEATNASTTAVSALDGAGDANSARQPVVTYVVEGGDTISSIASQFGISTNTVLWANGLGDRDFIKPGQTLKIPSVSGYLYTVKGGDSLAALAQKYKGQEDQILAANNLPLADAIQVGQDLIIPGGQPVAPPTPIAVATRQPAATTVFGSNPPPSVSASSARFLWPTVSRRINQYYRGSRHTGIDIDGDYSSPIYAAAGGTVTYAGADRSGYGLHITIDHGNGYVTLYGHASKIFVQRGQHVNQGQTIAMQGCTGRCTGVHVHFEVRYRGGFQNPLSFF